VTRVVARRWILAACGAAALAAIAFATCGRDHADHPSELSDRPDASDDDARAATTLAPRRRTADAAARGTDVARDDGQELPQVEGFPAVDVEVRHADGTPAQSYAVYALRAGSPGRWDPSSGPHATTDPNGCCRLPVARRGRFDVGAVRGPVQALVRDVDVPRHERVVIGLPPLAEVVVTVSEPAAAMLRSGRPVSLFNATYGRSDSLGAPGRDDRVQSIETLSLPEDARELRLLLPAGQGFRMEGVDGLFAEPREFRPPAVVRIDHEPRWYVKLRMRIEPTDAVPARDGWLAVRVDPGTGGSIPDWCVMQRVIAGRPVATQVRLEPRVVRVGGPEGVLRWSGAGVEPGQVEFSGLSRDAPSQLDVVVRLDGSVLPADDPGSGLPATTRYRVIDPLATGMAAYCVAASGPGGNAGRDVVPGAVVETSIAGEVWVVAIRRDEVAGPARAPRGRDALTEITLVRGGWIDVGTDAPPPMDLGPFTIGRRDDGMVTVEGCIARRVDLRRARRIGPMPPGEYEFVVRTGDEDLCDVRATVVAGETAKLGIPALAPR
jgi:hypothetical protein